MAGSSYANNVPEGTILVSVPGPARLTHRAASPATLSLPTRLNQKNIFQPANVCEIAYLDGKRALHELSSDTIENVPTPTRILGSVEFDTSSDSEKPHFSETLGKYLTYLKSIKCPRINNSKLLDGVDQVS